MLRFHLPKLRLLGGGGFVNEPAFVLRATEPLPARSAAAGAQGLGFGNVTVHGYSPPTSPNRCFTKPSV